jgi:hypothetical protein
MGAFGITALRKKEFKVTAGRKVTGTTARDLGICLLVGACGMCIPLFGGVVQIFILLVVIAIGLARSEKIEAISPTAGQ